NQREHFGCQTDGNCNRKKKCSLPVILRNSVNEKDKGNHDEHEFNQKPTDFVNPFIKTCFGSFTDNAFRSRTENSLITRLKNDCCRVPTDNIRSFKTEVFSIKNLFWSLSKCRILFYWNSLTCQCRLIDE